MFFYARMKFMTFWLRYLEIEKGCQCLLFKIRHMVKTKNAMWQEDWRMRLKEGKEGSTFEVADMTLPLDTERRLEVLGLTEGSTVQIMKNKKRGAMIVKIRGTRFALGEKLRKILS